MWVALIVRVLKEVHVFGRHEVVLLLLLGRTLLMLLRMKKKYISYSRQYVGVMCQGSNGNINFECQCQNL